MKHIFLIGYRGCGKSTIGRKLAKLLDVSAVDTDDVVEQTAGRSIKDIFDMDGEATFRDLESAAIKDTAAIGSLQVISLGGGAVLRKENRELIRQGYVVWLRAAPEVLADRVSRDKNSRARRPKLTDATSQLEEIKRVLTERLPLYEECANLQLDTEDSTVGRIAKQIYLWLIKQDDSLQKTTSQKS